jgi:hypothetical protein
MPKDRIGVLTALTAALLCAVGTATYAEETDMQFSTLAGPLPKVVEAAKGPYLVIADIEVPAGKLVTIEPGTVLLFKNFTGLHVQGRLVAEGTAARPLIFTSEFDKDYNPASSMYPNPYDWNGLYIHANAVGTSLSHSNLYYSVYGIISETKYIRIFSGSFANNGKTNLVIEGKEHIVADAPYTYELLLKDATVDGVPIRILRDPAAPKRNTFRFAGIGAIIGGAGMGVYSTLQWREDQERLEKLSDPNPPNTIDHSSAEWNDTRSERNLDRVLSTAGYCLVAIGAVGFGWSFSF